MGLKSLYELAMAAHGSIGRRFGRGFALPPAQLFIEVTDRCNLDCRMCFYRGTLGRADAPRAADADHLTRDEILALVRDVPTARLVSISGGEPFARADLPELLAALARDRLVTVETNGTLLDEPTARTVAALGSRGLPRPGLVALDFSILGTAEVHDRIVRQPGAFDRAIAALRVVRAERERLGRAFPKLTLKAAILRENLAVLEELAEIARAERVDYFVLKEEDPGKVTLDPGAAGGQMARGAGTKAPRPEALDGLAGRVARLIAPRAPGPEAFLIPLAITPAHLEHHPRHGVNLEGASCRHPWSRIGVLPRGEVYTCKLFATRSVRAGRGVRALWNGPELRAFRRELARAGAFPECAGCCFLEPGPLRQPAAAAPVEPPPVVPAYATSASA